MWFDSDSAVIYCLCTFLSAWVLSRVGGDGVKSLTPATLLSKQLYSSRETLTLLNLVYYDLPPPLISVLPLH